MRIINILSDPKHNHLNLNVIYDHSKHTLYIKSGNFRLAGVDYTLTEDEFIEIPTTERPTNFSISLVIVDGETRVFMDQIDDFDPPFEFNGSNMKKLADLAILQYAVNTYHDPSISLYQITTDDMGDKNAS